MYVSITKSDVGFNPLAYFVLRQKKESIVENT